MEKQKEQLRIVSEEQIRELVNKGWSYCHISFPSDTPPVYVPFFNKPEVDAIKSLLIEAGLYNDNNYRVTWSINSNKTIK